MPIPPRPIPNHGPRGGVRAHRPGTSVPRKAMSAAVAAAQHLDWRAEVALLGEASTSSAHPRSAPLLGVSPGSGPGSPSASGSGSGLRIVERMREVKQEKEREEKAKEKEALAAAATDGDGPDDQPSRTTEVSLEGLIAQSKGKREKRSKSCSSSACRARLISAATTATTLGFDFVPNPTVVALPDSVDATPPCVPVGVTAAAAASAPSSPIAVIVDSTTPAVAAAAADPSDTSALLSTSRDMKARAALLWGSKPASPSPTESAATPASVLPRTPCTPGLLPATGGGAGSRHGSTAAAADDDDASDFDSDWEHVSGEIETASGVSKAVTADRANDDDDLDGIILLGDMDLEEEMPDAPAPGKQQRKVLSYAAALGRSGARRLDVIRA